MSMYIYYDVSMQRIDTKTGALTLIEEQETQDIIAELLKQCPELEYRIDEDGRGTNDEGGEWDEEQEVMTAFSKRYPDILFNVDRNNHSHGERGDSYYLNGNFQVRDAHWEYEPIDLKKLGLEVPGSSVKLVRVIPEAVADEIGSALTIFRWLQIYKMYLTDNGLDDDTVDISVNNLAQFVKEHIPAEDLAAYENQIPNANWKP